MTGAADVVHRIVAGFLRRITSPIEEIYGIVAAATTAVLKRLRIPLIARTEAVGGVCRTGANFLRRTIFRKEDTCGTGAAVTIVENCRIKKSE